jgi:hypothetical protein
MYCLSSLSEYFLEMQAKTAFLHLRDTKTQIRSHVASTAVSQPWPTPGRILFKVFNSKVRETHSFQESISEFHIRSPHSSRKFVGSPCSVE